MNTNSSTTQKTSRQIQAEQSKQKIFDAAQTLFAKYGYDNVSISDICKKAGVSSGLFYNYFGSKSEIPMFSDGIIKKYYSDHHDEIYAIEDTIDRLTYIIYLALKIITTSPAQVQNARIHYTRACQGMKPSIYDESRSLINRIKKTLAEGRAKGEMRDIGKSDDEIAAMLYDYMIGLAIHLLDKEDIDEMSNAAEKARESLQFVCSFLRK